MAKVVLEFEEKTEKLLSSLRAIRNELLAVENAEKKVSDQSGKSTTVIMDNSNKVEKAIRDQTKELGDLISKQKKAYDPKVIEDYKKRIEQLEKTIKDLRSQQDKVTSQNNILSKSFTRIGTAIAGAFAVDRIIRFGSEAIALAGKLEGVQAAFNKLNNPRLLDDLRKATRGTVTDLELMQAAVRANNFQVPLGKLAGFFEFATKRASETGEEVDYLVNSIIDGIGRKSTLVLDNLGISATELQEEMKKTGDFGEAAGNIIQRELEKAGDVVETSAQKTARLNAEIENQKTILGQQLTPAWNSLLETLGYVLESYTDMNNEIKDFNTAVDIFTTAGQKSTDVLKLWEQATGKTANAWDRYEILLYGFSQEALRAAESQRQLNQALEENAEERERIEKILMGPFRSEEEAQKAANEAYFEQLKLLGFINEDKKEGTELTEEQIKKIMAEASAMLALAKAVEAARKEVEDLQREIFDTNIQPEDFNVSVNLDDDSLGEFGIDLDSFEDEAGVMVEGFDEATKKMAKLGIDNMSDYFKYLKKKSDENYQYFAGMAISLASQIANGILSIQDAQIAVELDATRQRIDRQSELNEQALLTEKEKALANSRLTSSERLRIEEFYDKRLTNQRIDAERRKLKAESEAAEKRKQLKLQEAIINTAFAVVSALPNYAEAAYAAIQGGIQIAVIESTPIPQYFEGTEYLQPWAPGQGTKKDDIPVMGHVGEAIINANRNKEAPGLAKAWNDGNLEEYIFKNYQMPAIQDALDAIKKQEQIDFANNVANSLALNFMDKNIIKEHRKGNGILLSIYEKLSNQPKPTITRS